MAIPAILFHDEMSEQRREDRWRIRLGARRFDRDSAGQPLTILELSSSGFRLETEQPLRTNTYLIVEMPGGISKFCKTIWRQGTLHGATFSEPLNESELEYLLGMAVSGDPSHYADPSASTHAHVCDVMPEAFDLSFVDESEKLPFVVRMRVIASLCTALWGLVAGGIWLAWG